MGFRYALGNLKKAPESLFAKRTYDTPIVEGAATVDVDYNLDSKVFAVDSKWVGKGKDSSNIHLLQHGAVMHQLTNFTMKLTLLPASLLTVPIFSM